MLINDVLFVKGSSGFYFDDQKAIKSGAVADGFTYKGEPLTPGFSRIRQGGEAVSIMLFLENGEIAVGDCVAVQYSGVDGRDPVFLADNFLRVLEEEIKPKLVGYNLLSFKEAAWYFDNLTDKQGKKYHTALRYGLTQALLDAVAKINHSTMAEVIAKEYGLKLLLNPVPLFAQSGDDRYTNADKMILKRVDVLPHGLFNHPSKIGAEGKDLTEYALWLKQRVKVLGDPDYLPIFHFDVYGTLGIVFSDNLDQVAEYLARLEERVYPHLLRVEGPVDLGSKERQIEGLRYLQEKLYSLGSKVVVVADEWCNNLADIKEFVDARAGLMVQIKSPDLGGVNDIIDAVLYAKGNGIGAYLGGSCNETDISAKVSVHVGLATGPDQLLVKPGMGVDEGLTIMRNEMLRTLAILKKNKSLIQKKVG
ncbi:methylaspartate ammonia-lyase [Carboxydothermus pertinax]|nr:methylaspartate ammonia-lyase [Carboxydothermus pertinax]